MKRTPKLDTLTIARAADITAERWRVKYGVDSPQYKIAVKAAALAWANHRRGEGQ